MDSAPQRTRMVMVTEERPLPRSTVPAFLDAVREAFAGPFKIERLVYERGRPGFTVERSVPEASLGAVEPSSAYLTAYQMVRQHADLDVQELGVNTLESLARAVQSLAHRGFRLTMFVCESKDAVRSWMPGDLRLEDVWGVPVLEDPEARERGVFVVGSRVGPTIREIEGAVLCRLGESR